MAMASRPATTKHELDPAITPEQIQKLIAKKKARRATCKVVKEGTKRFLVCTYPPLEP